MQEETMTNVYVCVYWSEISDLKKCENAILFVSVNIPFSHSKFFEMKLLVCRDREGDKKEACMYVCLSVLMI